MGRVRKQVYLDPEQDRKLREYAERWGCSEAGVIRIALDRLVDLDHRIAADVTDRADRLDDSYVDEDIPLTDEELEVLEAESEAWFREHPQPLGLSEAVFQDREGR